MKFISIKKAEYVSLYKIMFTFSDGVKREVNFENFLRSATHPQIKKYLDISLFKQFKIINGDIDWNDYELCFPVMDLYEGNIGSFDKEKKAKEVIKKMKEDERRYVKKKSCGIFGL